MKRLTKNNILKMIEMMKKYEETENKDILIKINSFISNISKDKHLYSKLYSYNLSNEQLNYVFKGGLM